MQNAQDTKRGYKDLTTGLSIRTQKILIVIAGSLSAFMYYEGFKLLFHF